MSLTPTSIKSNFTRDSRQSDSLTSIVLSSELSSNSLAAVCSFFDPLLIDSRLFRPLTDDPLPLPGPDGVEFDVVALLFEDANEDVLDLFLVSLLLAAALLLVAVSDVL